MLRAVTDREFATEVLGAPHPVAVYFHADWSPPCRLVRPIVERAAAQYAGRLELRICDTAANPTAEREQIDAFELGVPCIVVFDGGTRAEVAPGALNPERLAQVLDRWAR